MDDEGSARFVPPRIFDRSINDHQRSFLSLSLSRPAIDDVRQRLGEALGASLGGDRKSPGHVTSPKERRPRGVDRRPAVQTSGVSGDADYENVFRENFRRPRGRCWWSVHATDSRDPRQFPFYGRAIYHLTARHDRRVIQRPGSLFRFHTRSDRDRHTDPHAHTCTLHPGDLAKTHATRSPWTVESRSRSRSFGSTARLRGR